MAEGMPAKFDVSVVIATVCRPTLERAVQSVFRQKFAGRIQVLVGVDVDPYGRSAQTYERLHAACPPHVALAWLDLGWSTSARHGGVHSSYFGGGLPSALSFLAHSQFVMYLDDDDWLEPTHVARVMEAIRGKSWAFGLSFYADGERGVALGVDRMESVGPGAGVFKERYGGFVRRSGMLLDKLKCAGVLHLWSCALTRAGDGEDRLVFDVLRRQPYGFSDFPSVNYSLDPADGMHAQRVRYLESMGVDCGRLRQAGVPYSLSSRRGSGLAPLPGT